MANLKNFLRSSALLLVLAALGSSAVGQDSVSGANGKSFVPSGKSMDLAASNFRVLTSQAGYIFLGKVAAVSRRAASNAQEVATMQITFHVEQGLRGAPSGSELTVAEWAGLWNGAERYRVGDRVLLFLYPNSKLGLTSPVGGRQGRFEVNASGQVVLRPEHAVLLANEPGARMPGNRIPVREMTNAIRRSAMQEAR
jgi:hypothetical protein